MNESLKPNSNYPPMTDREWNEAPFNQPEPQTTNMVVYCSQSLSRDIETEVELDDDDEIPVDLAADYIDQHETPLSLIKKFRELLCHTHYFPDNDYLIKECDNWTEDEMTIDEA